MHQDIKEIFVTEQEIVEITKKLGKEISIDYENKQPILVGLLNGCVPFYSELIKNISIMMEFDFMDVKSYEGTQSAGLFNNVATSTDAAPLSFNSLTIRDRVFPVSIISSTIIIWRFFTSCDKSFLILTSPTDWLWK